MKLERLNENQIRCTLSKSDLEQRELRLSELAYGSAKARELFRDMIQQASVELGFEAENIPLMIEAIPISNECLILVVTKVEDPEELDTRFSRFSKLSDVMNEDAYESPYYDDDDNYSDSYVDTDTDGNDTFPFSGFAGASDSPEGSFDPLGLVAPFTQAIAEAKKQVLKRQQEHTEVKNHTRLFVFQDLDQIISLSAFLVPFYTGRSVLYKDTGFSHYYLFLHKNEASPELFNRACTIASDYGTKTPVSYASPAYCMEHCQLIFDGNALETLNQLNS